MTVTGEEKGLLGSEYYVKHPVFPLANTVCDINIDMVGRTDKDHEGKGDYIYVIGSDKLSSELHSALLEQNKKYSESGKAGRVVKWLFVQKRVVNVLGKTGRETKLLLSQ